jgi:cytochrome b561
MGSVGCVLKCQQSPKEEKGKWMWRHKSLGLLTGLIVAPRLGYRIFNATKYQVGHPTGTGPVEAKLADASHLALYAFMTIMPATGIASKCIIVLL